MAKNKVTITVETDSKKANRGLDKTDKKVKKLGGSLKETGIAAAALKSKLLIATGAIAGIAGAALAVNKLSKEFRSFEFQLGKVASLVDDTDLVFGEYAQGIRDLSVEFGQTKETLTDGLFDIISATIDTKDAMDVLRASTILAVGGFAETGAATSGLITVYQAFRDELKDTTAAADFLFAVQARGRLTVAQVASTIGTVASTVKAANVTLNEFGAMFSAISRAGAGAEATVVQMAAVIKVLNKPSKESIPILEKYGVAIGNASIANGELFKTINKLKGARIGEKTILFAEETALRGFNALVKESAVLHEDVAAQVNKSGLSVAAMEKAQKLAAQQVKRATEQINLQKEAIGKELTPAYIESLKAINDLIIGMIAVTNLLKLPFGIVDIVADKTIEGVKLLAAEIKELVGLQQQLKVGKGFALPDPAPSGIDKRGIQPADPGAPIVAITDAMRTEAAKWDDITKTSTELMLERQAQVSDFAAKGLFTNPQTEIRAMDLIAKEFEESMAEIKNTHAAFTNERARLNLDSKQFAVRQYVEEFEQFRTLIAEGKITDQEFKAARRQGSEALLKSLEDDTVDMIQLLKDFNTERSRIDETAKDFAILQFEEEFERFNVLLQEGKITQEEFDRVRIEGTKKVTDSIKEESTFLEQLARDTATSMHSSFNDFFFRLMKNDFEDFADFLDNLFDTILRGISSKFAAEASSGLGNIIGSLFSGGGGGGGLAPGQAGPPAPGGGGFLSGIGSFFGFADGGRVTKPTIGLIGEAGPEIVAPESDFNDFAESMKGGSDRPIILRITLNNPIDPAVFGKTDDEIITVVADGYARGKIIREVIRNDSGG